MTLRLVDNVASGTESLLGVADGLDADEMRSRLAMSTRYLANWYKATKGSPNQDIWWAQIDAVRAKVEASYAEMTQAANVTFAGKKEVADYNDASQSWVDLYNALTLSPDANQYGLLDQAADFVSTLSEAPGLIIPQIGDQLGKALGGAAGNFLAGTWPYFAAAGAITLVWIFREPLSRLAGKVVK